MKDLRVAGWFLAVLCLLGGSVWWVWHSYMTSPPYVDPERFPVRGIDLSAHNGYANLNAAAGAGYSFVFLKASEGTDFRDPNFVLNYNKARHAGMKTGAYHFFRFDSDGVEQGVNFLKSVGNRTFELGLAIDVEEHGNPAGIPKDTVDRQLARMVEYLNMRGHRITFYSNRDGYEKYIRGDYEGFPLWICSFDGGNSLNTDWTFWQFDHHGKVPGIRGDVDINAFRGHPDELGK